ncbi:tRNA lysidine(34) synthetase TilS [Candidatus Phytoplasma phoenicium]|uniref:tRNA(Ile)-lysidine synthase n=1 Tax=Candidatus Phytoplasma phoenicium TaxID=198422 RepID=A0A0L0MK37_9MOLU|nr:tRNA lysidine(34) synthetase TilS [Candidatus Phytoplasma phoenicium]KND62748.1 tRNA(Ile)-lysidine synthetase [Candidatus Phytoplasma phoenicium]
MKIHLAIKLEHKNIYIISVSGGVDSMVLLDFLYHRQFCLIVVYFDHCQRKDSFKDKLLIEQYCKTKNIPLHSFQLTTLETNNFQNNARLARQTILKQVASQYKTHYIITAHHLDDLAETIFMKILRGSSLLGYSGMKSSYVLQNFIWLKPFLYLSKQTIKNYAQQNNIPFLEDSTNNLDFYTRNKIRHHIIPKLKTMGNFLKKIKHFHLQIQESSDLITKLTNVFLKQQKSNYFELKAFLQLHVTIQKNILLCLLEAKQIIANFELISNIIEGLCNYKKPNNKWYLNKKWYLIKEYDKFFFQMHSQLDAMLLKKKAKPLLYSCINIQLLSFCTIKQIIFYDEGMLLPPFYLRQRQPGDILHFSFGSQKLKKFLINNKITTLQRNLLWLVVDQNNTIIFIPRLYFNKTLGQQKYLYLGLKEI